MSKIPKRLDGALPRCCCTVVSSVILFYCVQNAGHGLIIQERKNATDALGKVEPGPILGYIVKRRGEHLYPSLMKKHKSF